ncbi:hypothetical protein FPV67DRAFT_1715979 [Lyophyllum atratum]|nr:hypothetical protein FPV67DRAFT_1715979 [Lyophyllum atratum]
MTVRFRMGTYQLVQVRVTTTITLRWASFITSRSCSGKAPSWRRDPNATEQALLDSSGGQRRTVSCACPYASMHVALGIATVTSSIDSAGSDNIPIPSFPAFGRTHVKLPSYIAPHWTGQLCGGNDSAYQLIDARRSHLWSAPAGLWLKQAIALLRTPRLVSISADEQIGLKCRTAPRTRGLGSAALGSMLSRSSNSPMPTLLRQLINTATFDIFAIDSCMDNDRLYTSFAAAMIVELETRQTLRVAEIIACGPFVPGWTGKYIEVLPKSIVLRNFDRGSYDELSAWESRCYWATAATNASAISRHKPSLWTTLDSHLPENPQESADGCTSIHLYNRQTYGGHRQNRDYPDSTAGTCTMQLCSDSHEAPSRHRSRMSRCRNGLNGEVLTESGKSRGWGAFGCRDVEKKIGSDLGDNCLVGLAGGGD